MNIQAKPTKFEDKRVISNLMQLYLHDMSEYDRSDVSADGHYDYKYLDSYWEDPARQAFLITANDQLAGFALVNDYLPIVSDKPGKAIAEFFILRKYRRSGVGNKAAILIFNQYHGDWQVAQENENIPAQKFWEKIVSEYTHRNYNKQLRDDDRWRGPVLLFDSKKEA